MFDFRYFVATLAGLFLMLAVGILLGVGISGRGVLEDVERDRLEGQIAELRERVDAADETAADLQRRQEAAAAFVESAYPVLADERLAGARVGILVLGPAEQNALPFVERAVEEDADGTIVRMRALELPLRVDAVEDEIDAHAELGGYAGEDQLANVGRDLGREFVANGETPLWEALEGELVEERRGTFTEPLDAVVVIRSADPQAGPTSRFLGGLYRGLTSTGVPVVGVEQTRVEQSAVPVFQRYGISTVDGVDEELGQLATVLLLAGANPGDYGLRDTATDGILPPIEPA